MFCALLTKQDTWSEVWWRSPRICGCFCLYFALSFLGMVMLSAIWVKPNNIMINLKNSVKPRTFLIQKQKFCQKKAMFMKKSQLTMRMLQTTIRKLYTSGFCLLKEETLKAGQSLELSFSSVHILCWLLSWWIFWSQSWAAHLREWPTVQSSTPLKKKWVLLVTFMMCSHYFLWQSAEDNVKEPKSRARKLNSCS